MTPQTAPPTMASIYLGRYVGRVARGVVPQAHKVGLAKKSEFQAWTDNFYHMDRARNAATACARRAAPPPGKDKPR